MNANSPERTPAEVLVVVGTRPEAIKLLPLIVALQESPLVSPVVVSTGQHRDMVTDVLDLAGTAWKPGNDNPLEPTWATGWGVRILDRLIADNYED